AWGWIACIRLAVYGISSPKAVMVMYEGRQRAFESVERILLAFPAEEELMHKYPEMKSSIENVFFLFGHFQMSNVTLSFVLLGHFPISTVTPIPPSTDDLK
ncbi:hypothetical protein Tco_1160543, partial [Tanacetum coccineum]